MVGPCCQFHSEQSEHVHHVQSRKSCSAHLPSFSLIRTVTVGSGIAPDLLSLGLIDQGARGLQVGDFGLDLSPPVGNFTPPRELFSFSIPSVTQVAKVIA